MKVQKDLPARLRNLRLEFQVAEDELRKTSDVDIRSLQEFRQSLDDLRMTAWTVSELANARTSEKDPQMVRTFLAAERLRRFSQMARDLSGDLEAGDFTWETAGIQSLFESLNALQTRLSKMVAAHRAQFTAAPTRATKS